MDLTKLMEACEKYNVELTINGKMIVLKYDHNGTIFKKLYDIGYLKSLRRECHEMLIEIFAEDVKAEIKRLCVRKDPGNVTTMDYLGGGDIYV